MLEVVIIPVLSDNYIWLMHDDQSDETIVIDPAVSKPVLQEAEKRGWNITQIWNTHWHPDHTGGNAEIKEATGCKISGPEAEAPRIPTLDILVNGGDRVTIGNYNADVIDVPAHTSGHIAYYIPDENILFVGDTLFAMGCGRLFEGTPAQMYDNMQKLSKLPDDTIVYCAHEYTQSNGEYALVAEPDNQAIKDRMKDVIAARGRGEYTVPTTIALEKATNPFMRSQSAEILAERRTAKDNF